MGSITPLDNLVYNATVEWFPGFVYIMSCVILVAQGAILLHMLWYIRSRGLGYLFTKSKEEEDDDPVTESTALVSRNNGQGEEEEIVDLKDL